MTAADTHADALATLRAALEVEEAATPGPWRVSVEGIQGGPVVRAKDARVARAYRCNYPDYVPDAENARAIVLARLRLKGTTHELHQAADPRSRARLRRCRAPHLRVPRRPRRGRRPSPPVEGRRDGPHARRPAAPTRRLLPVVRQRHPGRCVRLHRAPPPRRAGRPARAILRPALEGSIEALEQHRPQRTTAPHCDPDCVGPHYGFTRWPCPDARRALVIAEAAGGAE